MLLRTGVVAAVALVELVAARTYKIPNVPSHESTRVEFKAGAAQLDGQKITPRPSSSQYEW